MNLIPWRTKRDERDLVQPERGLSRLRDEMDHLFERFMRDPFGMDLSRDLAPLGGFAFGPAIDVEESDKEVTVRAELAGVDPKDVEINVSGTTLTLKGEKKQEREEKKKDYHFMERRYGSFHRSIQLPSSIDPDKVDATYKNGVLTVAIQKRPEARPKRIEVKKA